MLAELGKITSFILQSVIHIWPYLLIAIPAAVVVNMSGASKYIGKAFIKRPFVSIILATVIGAFSPFCSCGVIPVIASLLIGGVPLAPIMSFWLASPSMDPEIFFLSVSILGWKLAIWRLSSAFLMSLSAGFLTYYLTKNNWIKADATLKAHSYSPLKTNFEFLKNIIQRLKLVFNSAEPIFTVPENRIPILKNEYGSLPYFTKTDKAADQFSRTSCCDISETHVQKKEIENIQNCGCGSSDELSYELPKLGCCDDPQQITYMKISKSCSCSEEEKKIGVSSENCCTEIEKKKTFWQRLFKEVFSATSMVVKFMLLAYFLESLIVLYLPTQVFSAFTSGNKLLSIVMAAVIGVPVYTSSIPALALVAGLIGKGIEPAAGLAFLISGPTTTLPAMAAVWNLTNRKVFLLYVGFTLIGAILSGALFYISEIAF